MDASAQVAFSVQSARAIVRRSSSFTYLFSLLLPAGDRPFFWTWYAYLRWVDDIADNATLLPDARCDFLARQIQLVQDLYSGKRLNLSKDEAPLSALVDYDSRRGQLLKEPLSKMLGAMEFDIQRQGQLSGHTELHRSFDHEVANYLFTIGYFCRIPDIPAKVPGRAAANGAKTAHILRDFLCDIDEGVFNVSREELDAYGLAWRSLKVDITRSAGRRWVAANVRLAGRQLESGFREASEVGGFRYPVIVAILVAKYQAYLDQIRANDFILQPQTRLGYGFARNLFANLAALLLRRPRRTRRSMNGELPDRRVACPTPARARFLLGLLPVFNRSAVRALDEATSDVDIPPGNLRKLRRRFVTAYWLGRTSCASIDPARGKQDDDRIHCAGLIYAFWSLAVLELDKLIDDFALPSEEAQALVAEWLGKAADALESTGLTGQGARPRTHRPESSGEQGRLFRAFADAFQARLSQYRRLAAKTGSGDPAPDTFLAEAEAFLNAQIDSRDQRTVDPSHDWNWYLTRVINQKTLGFALAPMALWVRDGKCQERRRKLEHAFLALNGGYWHWQILDDVADLDVDMRQGRVTTPGFVLLSQGALARTYLEAGHARETAASTSSFIDAILDSELVCGRFMESPLSDDYRHLINHSRSNDTPATCASLMRCALTNSEDDHLADLTQLSLARRDQAVSYLTAVRASDWDTALNAVAQSRVGIRILTSVDEDIARIEAKEQLASIRDPASRTMLWIIELLIRHCYRKARRANSWMTGQTRRL